MLAENWNGAYYLHATYAYLGRTKELERLDQKWEFPQFNLTAVRMDAFYRHDEDMEHYLTGLRRAGVTEFPYVEEYDPATDTWTRKADMPTPRLHLTSAVVDGKIYVFGGSPEWAVPLAATEAYDPATDTWTKLADMPTPRTGIWAAALNGKIYVVGGIAWENEALATVEEYDPATDSWRSMADMPTPRFLLPVEAVGDEVYAIGGSTSDYTTLKAVEAFKP